MAIQISLPDDVAWQVLDLLDGAMYAAPDGVYLAPLELLHDKIMIAATRRAGERNRPHRAQASGPPGRTD
jgi:hypothetical protein